MFKNITFFSLLISLFFSSNSFANNLYEYNLVSSQAGLGIYEKDNDYGYGLGKIYVQRINMKYVDVKLIQPIKSGEYFAKSSLVNYWNILSGGVNALSISNGGFFEDLQSSTTKLSFPLKVDGTILTMGASTDYLYDRKMVVFKNVCASGYKCALVMNYSYNSFNSSSYPNAIVGLDPYVNKSSVYPIGRTFVGVDVSNSSNPIMYIVHGTQATQSEMRSIMYDLDVYDNAMVMFDGSGSSQLAFGNTKVYGYSGGSPDKREIPQLFVVTKK